MTDESDRPAVDPLAAGARAILPLALGIVPFALVYGVTVTQSSIPDLVGGSASVIVLAGAAQLALIDLLDQGAPWTVAVATALVINARFVLYSAALAPAFSAFPPAPRYMLSHLITDQAAVTALLHYETEHDPTRRMRYYLGAGGLLGATWVLGTVAGIVFGARIPDAWDLGFAIPLMFLALLVPTLRDRPAGVTALVAAITVVLARAAPFNLAIIVGALTGVLAGMAVRR